MYKVSDRAQPGWKKGIVRVKHIECAITGR
jgi:hypothetical protein